MDRQNLLTLLAAHRPHDGVEAEHVARMRALLDAGGRCFARDHFVPGHFTASAFALSPAGDRLLLIFHPKLARWLQPGGHIESTDACAARAARRELLEETGLAEVALHPAHPGLFDLDIHEIPARPGEPAHLHFDLRFLFQVADPGAVCTEEGIEAHAWLPLGEAAARGDASIARAVAKLTG